MALSGHGIVGYFQLGLELKSQLEIKFIILSLRPYEGMKGNCRNVDHNPNLLVLGFSMDSSDFFLPRKLGPKGHSVT